MRVIHNQNYSLTYKEGKNMQASRPLLKIRKDGELLEPLIIQH